MICRARKDLHCQRPSQCLHKKRKKPQTQAKHELETPTYDFSHHPTDPPWQKAGKHNTKSYHHKKKNKERREREKKGMKEGQYYKQNYDYNKQNSNKPDDQPDPTWQSKRR